MLNYYITTGTVQGETANFSSYGIEVVKSAVANGVAYGETEAIYDITTSEKEIRNIAEIIVKNAVTPISLKDVVEDIMLLII